MASPYHFRPMTPADLPQIKQWLALPHVREWWGDPAEQYALVSGDLDEPAMDQFIVAADASDLGYIQCYDLTAWNSGFGLQPEGTRLAQGAPRIVTDPDPANARAIRAYEKAGFRKMGMVDTPDGPALLMARDA